MKILYTIICISFFGSLHAQQDLFLKTLLARLENSRRYLIDVAEAMPEEKYGYTPTPEEMTFADQLLHISFAVDLHAQSALLGRKFRGKDDTTFIVGHLTKKEMIELTNKTFLDAINGLKKFSAKNLGVKFDWGGKKITKEEVFFRLMDHITHHRGQMVVYLRLNGIKPPEYGHYQ